MSLAVLIKAGGPEAQGEGWSLRRSKSPLLGSLTWPPLCQGRAQHCSHPSARVLSFPFDHKWWLFFFFSFFISPFFFSLDFSLGVVWCAEGLKASWLWLDVT